MAASRAKKQFARRAISAPSWIKAIPMGTRSLTMLCSDPNHAYSHAITNHDPTVHTNQAIIAFSNMLILGPPCRTQARIG